jgi:hypothetical protein
MTITVTLMIFMGGIFLEILQREFRMKELSKNKDLVDEVTL